MSRISLRSFGRGPLCGVFSRNDVALVPRFSQLSLDRSCSRAGRTGEATTLRRLTRSRPQKASAVDSFESWRIPFADAVPLENRAEECLSLLSEDQRKAATHQGKVVRVIAGPGSGKTRVLVGRVPFLLSQGHRPEQLLVVTFTNKAANEMVDRLDRLYGSSQPLKGLWTGTFHSVARRILQRYIRRLGQNWTSEFQIITPEDAEAILLEILMRQSAVAIDESDSAEEKKLKRKENTRIRSEKKKQCRRLYDGISAAKEDFATTHGLSGRLIRKAYEAETGLCGAGAWRFQGERFAKAYDDYETYLMEKNMLDFGDLMSKVVYLLQHDSHVLSKLRSEIKHILVDEMQDTNGPQYAFLKLLTKENAESSGASLFAVGDPNQSIYAFRGAQMNNLQAALQEDFPESVATLFLLKNFRSRPEIVRTAESVIAKFVPKALYDKMVPVRSAGDTWTLQGEELETDIDEADTIVRMIQYLTKEACLPLNRIAVLYRTHRLSTIFERKLVEANIACYVRGSSVWERTETKDCLAYLRYASNPKDDLALARIYNVPKRGIGARTFDNLRAWCHQENRQLSDFLVGDILDVQTAAEVVEDVDISQLNIPKEAKVTKGARTGLHRFRQLFVFLRSVARGHQPETVLSALIEDCGYGEYLQANPGLNQTAEKRLDNLEELHDTLRFFAQQTVLTGLEALRSVVDEVILLREAASRRDVTGVQLMTMHSAKGLEFSAVFLVSCDDDTIPLQSQSSTETEEEARLFFVAMTRAEDYLFISSARSRMKFGERKDVAPSRFLGQIPEFRRLPDVWGW